MANIAKRGNGMWRARYRDRAGKEVSKHFQRKVDAQRWLDSVSAAMATGTYVDPTRARITVGELAQTWLDSRTDLRATTRRDYESILAAHLIPRWGQVPLSAVHHEDVTSWLADLSRSGLSASRVRATHGTLSQVMKYAVRAGRLQHNPADYVPLPRLPRAPKDYLTHEQVERLADAAGDYRAPVLFLAYTGVRYGEMAALRVRNLDLERRRATIVESVTEVAGRLVFSTTKTHRSRVVPVPRFLLADLRVAIDGRALDDQVFTRRGFFAGEHANLLRLTWFRRYVFQPAVEKAGLDGLTPHGLRHTAASLAIASGADVKVVQAMLGHASATMTLDLYGHLYPDRLDEVSDAMDSARTAARRRAAENLADSVRTGGPEPPGISM